MSGEQPEEKCEPAHRSPEESPWPTVLPLEKYQPWTLTNDSAGDPKEMYFVDTSPAPIVLKVRNLMVES